MIPPHGFRTFAVSLATIIALTAVAKRPREISAATAEVQTADASGPTDSLLKSAGELKSAVLKTDSEAQAFTYRFSFDFPYIMPGDTHPPSFDMDGEFESAADQVNYWDAVWSVGDSKRHHGVQINRGVFRPFNDGCGGAKLALPIWPSPAPEPAADHPPLRGWSIDFPVIFRAVSQNRSNFYNGVAVVTVTTAKRLKLTDEARDGCGGTIYNGSASYRRLRGVDDAKPVVEIDETPKPLNIPGYPIGYCAIGHYLILDAGNGAIIERSY